MSEGGNVVEMPRRCLCGDEHVCHLPYETVTGSRYPAGAIDAAIVALELSYSYLRNTGKEATERSILDALDRLNRAKELEEPAS